MTVTCCVLGCKNYFKLSKSLSMGISYYRFPKVKRNVSEKNKKLLKMQRDAWRKALGLPLITDSNLNCFRVCSAHFITGKPANYRDVDNPDWLPQVKMGYETNECSNQTKYDRYRRRVERDQKKSMQAEAQMDSSSTPEEEPPIDSSAVNFTDPDTESRNRLFEAMQAELIERNAEIYKLREDIGKYALTEESFQNDDAKLKYYTELPSLKVFKLILTQIEPALSKFKVKHLDNFQKLLLTLMKLRLNTPFRGLGYRFNIRADDASTCFKKVIVLIEYTFRGFVHWPDRDSLRTALPQVFKDKFGNSVAIIIDCFEIHSQRPSNVKARGLGFSSYKHNYTAKYLIGITPHGFISFVSDGWEGHASDKFLTEQSGLLENLLPGDIIMSDRGFTIKENISMQYAELLTPDFLQNKKQLGPEAIEKTRKIASVRIHILRVIGVLKNKYKILKGPIPIHFMTCKIDGKCLLDYIVRTSCILTNLCDSVVPMLQPKRQNDNIQVALDETLLTERFEIIQ